MFSKNFVIVVIYIGDINAVPRYCLFFDRIIVSVLRGYLDNCRFVTLAEAV